VVFGVHLAAASMLAGLALLVPPQGDLGVDSNQQLVHVVVDPYNQQTTWMLTLVPSFCFSTVYFAGFNK
jgi:hypothetical protein